MQGREVLGEVWQGFLLRFMVGRPKAQRTSKIKKKTKKNTVKTQGHLAGLGARWRDVCAT